MQQLIDTWAGLDMRRKLAAIFGVIAMIATVFAIGSIASKPTLALLYAGLGSSEAGEVISALEQRGVAYEVRGDSIFVAAPQRDELRMTLASQGLPATGGAGYELLDSLSGFGTTSQMFDAAYWRAKEGELARTIAAVPSIRSARVHIAHPTNMPFRGTPKPTASVTITPTLGGLSGAQAKAVRYLVASAVTGMTPEDVSVIDSARGLIPFNDNPALPGSGEDRAQALKQNVERLLEARVGPGNVVVEVALDTATEREAITERRFDPEGRVAISTDTSETSKTSDSTTPPATTVASNLPDNGTGATGKSQSRTSETRARTNFEVSETRRELLRAPGALKRLSVAVLVDGVRGTNPDGTPSWEPRSDAELADLRELVASAVGFDEARGDVITLRSMQFEALPEAGTVAGPGFIDSMALDLTQIIQIAVLAVVALVLGLFVARPILLQKSRAGAAELPAPSATEEGATASTALTGEIDDREMPDMNMQLVSDFDLGDLPMATQADFDLDRPTDPVDRLKKMIEERQAETVEILRSWMEEPSEKT
ncbi:flagellar M-ring protein FliF [Thioclava electrotropha]|uniref:Flagellar M-ring protein n=2 Tax=Thioclava electrotropha TaxID=1549850 RepID=A0ABX6YPA0_9RHOB|nr:flagellar M-ring protein FliF [Thioclava electrotropha]